MTTNHILIILYFVLVYVLIVLTHELAHYTFAILTGYKAEYMSWLKVLISYEGSVPPPHPAPSLIAGSYFGTLVFAFFMALFMFIYGRFDLHYLLGISFLMFFAQGYEDLITLIEVCDNIREFMNKTRTEE